MIRTCIELLAADIAGVGPATAWWRLRRRSWLMPHRDDAMRRHINQHYS